MPYFSFLINESEVWTSNRQMKKGHFFRYNAMVFERMAFSPIIIGCLSSETLQGKLISIFSERANSLFLHLSRKVRP